MLQSIAIWAMVIVFLTHCSSVSKPLRQKSSARSIAHLSPVEKYFFYQIALYSEFGAQEYRIRKWQQDIKIFVQKNWPLNEELGRIIADLNSLLTKIQIHRVDKQSEANTIIVYGHENTYLRMVPELRDTFARLEKMNIKSYSYLKKRKQLAHLRKKYSQIPPAVNGFFYVKYNTQFVIERAYIFINHNSTISLADKKHILREEVTQSLGLMNDFFLFNDSIFFSKYSQTTQFSELDKKMIRILYNPQIKPGMTKQDLEKIF